MRTSLHTFMVNDAFYHHVLELDNDSTYLLDDSGNVIFSVNSSGELTNRRNEIIGRFSIDNNQWSLLTGDIRLETGESEIVKAEVKIFEWAMTLVA